MSIVFQNDGQFPVLRASVADILRHYRIDSFSYTVATSGIENTTCLIDTPGQKYALRIYRQSRKPMAAIEHEIAYMHAVRDKGLPIPEVYPNQAGQLVTQVILDGKVWEILLMECMPGKHPFEYTAPLLDGMARAQADMHVLGSHMAHVGDPNPEPTELVEREFVTKIDLQSLRDDRLAAYIERITNYHVPLHVNLPCGYSHFDFDMGNILVDSQNNLTAILDFDDLHYAPLVMCLGYTLWSILYETEDLTLVEQYLAQYEKTRQLHGMERQYLPRVMLFRHYVITALKILNGHTTTKDIERYERLEHLMCSMPSL